MSETHLVIRLHAERLSQVADIVWCLQLGNAAVEHHGEESAEEGGVFPETKEGLATQLLEPAAQMRVGVALQGRQWVWLMEWVCVTRMRLSVAQRGERLKEVRGGVAYKDVSRRGPSTV